MDIKDKFTQKGGVRLDTNNATWPFAKIVVTRGKIKLKIFSNEYELGKDEIIELREYRGLFSKGILIEHKRADYPEHMAFWTLNFKKLKQGIEVLGYTVGPPNRPEAWWRDGP